MRLSQAWMRSLTILRSRLATGMGPRAIHACAEQVAGALRRLEWAIERWPRTLYADGGRASKATPDYARGRQCLSAPEGGHFLRLDVHPPILLSNSPAQWSLARRPHGSIFPV
jgi:hypothetical protein